MKLRYLFLQLLLAGSLHGQSAETAKGFRPLNAALHVHSRFSNGEYEILELASQAHERKLDVLGISDSFLTRVRYGVGPFKKLMSRTMSRDAVLDKGLDRYFDSIGNARERFDDVILLPGFEVAPYYYWEGRWPGQLVLHDFDRHVLVYGINDAATARNLPVAENATWSNTERSWILAAGPATCLLIGLLAATRKHRGPRIAGLFILLVGVSWTYDAYPYAALPSPYSGKHDTNPFQRLIDFVRERGGVTYWSYPEARYPDVFLVGGKARMVSHGEPENLGFTDRYTGFEGLYGDTITITRPGHLWDKLLMEYVHKGRTTWPSTITGIDFHGFKTGNGWYQLDQGMTVLFASERSPEAVVEALRLGRGYSSFMENPKRRLVMEDFALRSAGNAAIAGETLRAGPDVQLTARLDWKEEYTGPTDATVVVTVVRDGELIERRDSRVPASVSRQDRLAPGLHYYRVIMQFGGSQILSNPIFCEVPEIREIRGQ